MEYDEIMGSRLSVLESRIAALEQQLFVLTRGGAITLKRRKRELTPEQKVDIRARLVAGQENARLKREAGVKTTKKEQKEVTNGAPAAED